jgi:hypothetical protein
MRLVENEGGRFNDFLRRGRGPIKPAPTHRIQEQEHLNTGKIDSSIISDLQALILWKREIAKT